MIASLTGTVHKLSPELLTIEVQGVGYLVHVPIDVAEKIESNEEVTLQISTYVREDRLELYGFTDAAGRKLFEELVKMSGIGTNLALDLCAVPRSMLLQAISDEDSALLTSIKGIGKKRAEKLLVDLRSLVENHPSLFAEAASTAPHATFDQDAIAALSALGYDNSTIMQALKDLPSDLESTEERVSAALRSL